MISLFNKSHFSILSAYSRPAQIVETCAEFEYDTCGIVDTNSVSSAYQFLLAAKKHNIRPVIGCDLSNTDRQLFVFCMNLTGWKNITHILYEGLTEERANNLVFVTDKPALFPFVNSKYLFNINDVAFSLTRYSKENDFRYADMIYKIGGNEDRIFNQVIQESWVFKKKHGTDKINNTRKITDLIEPFTLESRPKLPKFIWTEGKSEDEYLRVLCRQGWRNIIVPRLACIDQQEYVDRINKELEVVSRAGLAGYFLIVQDYVNWAKRNGILVGCGRGSSGGSLIAYLTGITAVDPIQHSLLFERFYNDGRNTATRVSLPDIDTDFPVSKREDVIAYIVERYGKENVSNMAAFSTLCGRGALKEVMRYDNVSFEHVNSITKLIIEENKVEDQMEDTGHTSVLSWMLEFRPKILQEFVRMNSDGTLVGDYADYFRQAMNIEGTIKSITQHASGLVISSDKILDVCPMINRDGHDIAAMEMNDLEAVGLVKVDILGLALLEKLANINKLLKLR